MYICNIHIYVHKHYVKWDCAHALWLTLQRLSKCYLFLKNQITRILLMLCHAVHSHSVMSDSLQPMDYSLPGSSVQGDPPSKNTGVGGHVLLQGIFPTQGSNPGLSYSRKILHHLNHQESPLLCKLILKQTSINRITSRKEFKYSSCVNLTCLFYNFLNAYGWNSLK